MTIVEITTELKAIGSMYNGFGGWTHANPERGKVLVTELTRLNNAVSAKRSTRPKAWGARGEAGTIVCIACGKRGQDRGTVCDHCGTAL